MTMDPSQPRLETAASLSGMLGYLNFSAGKPEARFQKQLDDAFLYLAGRGVREPWLFLRQELERKLDALSAGESSAFKDIGQARAVLGLVFNGCLPAYRQHHADLLFHQSDTDLFGPFFLARMFEAVLAQGPPWEESDRIVSGALHQLNDFVGYRPVALLETRPKGEPYAHERVRPAPLYIRGVGVSSGRYHDLIAAALDILADTDDALLADAYFQLDLLDELAMDPRAYDQGHPVHRRPNYIFGEWDPEHLDNQGRFRRFVLRQLVLDGLLERVNQPGELEASQVLLEAATVLSGTILMAAGVSGSGPAAHDSATTLATLIPRIAQSREAFYAERLSAQEGAQGDRLRQEAALVRQPFGKARQHLNEFLANHRARQLQHRHLAILFAEMGYPEASRHEAARIPTVSVRFLSDILSRLSTGHRSADRGELGGAALLLGEIDALVKRGIACGALADPWNILGFQGLFPLSPAREDSVRDTRLDDLVLVVEQLMQVYTRFISEAAATGAGNLVEQLLPALGKLAAWWDQFASVEVHDVRRVHGGEMVKSAEHVAKAMGRWHAQGEAAGDLAFWKQHLEGFRSPKAFALVVDALLRKEDYRASMALLIHWVAQVEQVPLNDGAYSFHAQALQWMLAVTRPPAQPTAGEAAATSSGEPLVLVQKFFDYLEANAGDYWQVPVLALEDAGEELPEDEEENTFEAAYEDMTYRDSTDDGQEGEVWDEGTPRQEFVLETESEALVQHLGFLTTVARLWQIAARKILELRAGGRLAAETVELWLKAAQENHGQLAAFLDAVHALPVPEPFGSHESMLDYDRRRVLKEQLLYTAIGTCLETALAVGALRGSRDLFGRSGTAWAAAPAEFAEPGWEPAIIRLERAIWRGDAREAGAALPDFVRHFRSEPLLFTALADGGHPRQIVRARLAQSLMRALVVNLPRLGLVRHTYQLLKLARQMEGTHRPESGRGVSEFTSLFHAGFGSIVDAVVQAAADGPAPPIADRALVELLEVLSGPFLVLWTNYCQSLQLSSLETIRNEEWDPLRVFIKRYGRDLFHARFMTLANLRGIQHRGVATYVDYLRDNPDPLHPVRLVEDLEGRVDRSEAERSLDHVIRVLVENYEEFKDYNTTTAHSDYGDNLYMLLDFLRLKVNYQRQAWQFRPLMLAHEVLARKSRSDAAFQWQEAFSRLTQDLASRYIDELHKLEQLHGIRLRTVRDLIEERFTRPLALDRLCALIAPAMEEARQGKDGRSFARLEKDLAQQTEHPTGVGLDVPIWLRRLQSEVQRVQISRSAVSATAEESLRVPTKTLSLEEIQRQIQDWEQPL
jgi:hypothetical protein